MKKIISVIAALAMVGAFVGCGPIDLSFKEHTETIVWNNGSAYPISSCDQRIGKDVIEVTFDNDSTNPDYKTVTLLSKQEGNAAMILESEKYCKRAEVSMTVLGTGSISGIYDLKEYLYSRSTANAKEGIWKDVPGTNPLGLTDGLYRLTDNNEDDIANEGSLSYILVDGKIVYYIYYKAVADSATVYTYQFTVTFVRTIMNETSGNITLTYDSKGAVSVYNGAGKFFAEEKYNTTDATKYGITDGGWSGSNWRIDGKNLTNGAAVYAPYDSLPQYYGELKE